MRSAAAIVCVCAVILGCEIEDADDGGTTEAAESSSTSDESSSSSTTTTSTSSSTTGPTGPKRCRRNCEAAFDCCPAGLEGCPSPSYPGNVGCVDGSCIPASCGGDDDCQAQLPGSSCVSLDSVLQCVLLCSSDEACAAINLSMTCGPATDTGMDYCGARCETDAIVCSGACDEQTGRCVCESDDDCAVGFTCR